MRIVHRAVPLRPVPAENLVYGGAIRQVRSRVGAHGATSVAMQPRSCRAPHRRLPHVLAQDQWLSGQRARLPCKERGPVESQVQFPGREHKGHLRVCVGRYLPERASNNCPATVANGGSAGVAALVVPVVAALIVRRTIVAVRVRDEVHLPRLDVQMYSRV